MSGKADHGIPNAGAGTAGLAGGVRIGGGADRDASSDRRVSRQRSRAVTPVADRLGPLIAPPLEPVPNRFARIGSGKHGHHRPFALAEMQAGLLKLFPNPPLTRDQVRLLKTDKVVSGTEPTLGDLGVEPRPLEEFLAVFKDISLSS
jgi:hypothetical protein